MVCVFVGTVEAKCFKLCTGIVPIKLYKLTQAADCDLFKRTEEFESINENVLKKISGKVDSQQYKMYR